MQIILRSMVLGGAGLLFYTWIGYGLLLWLVAKARNIQIAKAPVTPGVTVIVAARNEEQNIGPRIENLLLQDYPSQEIEIIIASDGSKDRTAEIARKFYEQGVRLLEFQESRGRATVHNEAVESARGEILVFTDAATRFERSFLRELMGNFADTRVGCVSGEIAFENRDASDLSRQRSLYWRYEYWLRKLENRSGILVCASGPCMAVRKKYFRALTDGSYDVDFITPLDVISQGHMVVQDAAAVAVDEMFPAPRQEFRAQVRMVSRNLRGYADRGFLLSLPGKACFAWSLVSHKVLRWLTPFVLLIILAATTALAAGRNRAVLAILGAQLGFYLIAFAGWWRTKRGCPSSRLSAPFAFCLANLGFLVGVLRCLRQQRISVY